MIKHESYLIDNNQLLFNILTKDLKSSNKLGILGGHFLLLFNESSNCLEPSIWQTSSNTDIKEYAKIIMGDFPINSLRFSLDLTSEAIETGVENSIFLVVNDHFFHSDNNPQIFKQGDISNTDIKRQYYDQNIIPDIYIEEGANKGIEMLKYIDKPIKSKGISSNNQYLISETQLRRKFDRSLKRSASKNKYFNISTGSGSKSELFFKNNELDICLTQNGVCGCSGEVMQLLYEAFINNYDSLIFLVPTECHKSVSNAVVPAITLVDTDSNPIKHVSIVSGFGDNNYRGINHIEYKLDIFKVVD